MAKASITVSLPAQLIADVDALVEAGEYDDRSEAVRAALESTYR